jgi:hypothetical protein
MAANSGQALGLREGVMQYEIRLEGILDHDWACWFGALALVREGEGVTLLICSVPDQTALFGILRKVRDLGMPLLSVYRVPEYRNETEIKK